MTVPNWWTAALLALAAWRVFHLIAHDDILDKPRRRLLRLHPGWKEEGDNTGPQYRETLGSFVKCPYCAGFWICLIWWVAWQIEPHWTLVATVPFVLNAGLIGAQRILSSE